MKNEIIGYLREFITYKGSLISLILSIFTGVGAGIFLASFSDILLIIPGLIVLILPTLALRGNIYSSLSSRIGSAIHLGLINRISLKDSIIKENLISSTSLAITISVIVGIIAKIFSIALGIESISLFGFIFISVLSAMISGIFLIVITLVISYISFKKNWDTDNITSPIITAFGDLLTIPVILFTAFIMLNSEWIVPYFSIIFMILALLNIVFLYSKNNFSEKYNNILKQSIPILILAVLLDIMSGIIIETQVKSIIMTTLFLVIFTAFIGQGGSIGTLMVSRLSTKLHLGTISPTDGLSTEVKKEIIRTYTLSFIMFPLLGLISFFMASIFNIATEPFITSMLTIILAGFVLTTIIIIISYFTSVLSFKNNIDPDNISIPLITGTVDLLGIVVLLISSRLFGLL